VALWHRENSWGWRLVGGIVSILAGLFVLANPLFSTIVVAEALFLMLGISAFVMGLTGLFSSRSLGSVILSLAAIAIGVMIMFDPLPLVGLVVLIQWIGLVAIAAGVLSAVATYVGRHPTAAS